MPPRSRPTSPPPAGAGARAGARARSVGKGAVKAPIFGKGQKASVSAGSLVVGMMAYALGVNYLQHGWPGVTAWLKAKLMNQTSQDGNGIPQAIFHTGPGAGPGSTGTQQAAAVQPPPAHPAAPTPSGGTLYA